MPRESPEETLDMLVPEEPQVPENEEISINYSISRKVWNRNKTDVDDTFAYNVALNVMENEEDQEPKYVNECMHRKDWPKWKDAKQTELNSLTKREVFGPVVRTPEVHPVGYKWVFVRKRNEKNEIVRYKASLMAQDLNIIGTPGELPRAVEYLKWGFEMKDLGKAKFCLGLQIEHLKGGILVHQETYVEKVLKRFYMDKSHPLSTLMVVMLFDVENEHFRPPTDDEDIIGPEVPYLSAIGALMFPADVGYLSDPHIGRSQTGYVFTIGGTPILWRSTKQTMVATSSNHAEIL
ncbi:hypothetical protein OSB04_008144 [Centaurea solstitialis]|uniref:Reverse transcriptase Ty1/copia-type domain-containing protein n=1 Tax=Centaurea solstitialis TaxID=347529 RepID=A0AA38WSZ7_9ASTR|nr:hypothetical protein OSB04_008144 [Centaurea solstitialis]